MIIKKFKIPMSFMILFSVVVLVAPLYLKLLIDKVSPKPSINLTYEGVNEKLMTELGRLESERKKWEATAKFQKNNGVRLAIKFGLTWTRHLYNIN